MRRPRTFGQQSFQRLDCNQHQHLASGAKINRMTPAGSNAVCDGMNVMTKQNNDRNLLFGILGLQVGFISQTQLVDSMQQWLLEKDRPIEAIIVRNGFMTQQYAEFLTQLVDKHLQLNGGEIEKSIAALSSVHDVRKKLEALDDPDLDATLSRVIELHRQSFEETIVQPSNPADQAASSRPVSNPGDRFRILRPHARGGLGEISVAEDTELHREVALKQIRDPYSKDSASRARFMVEAEVTGQLEHPGIVPVHSLGQDKQGRPFYVMRFIRGNSLKDAIHDFHSKPAASDTERRLQLHGLIGRLVDVCNAMEYAHSRGVLHRDLKPGNIMLGRYGETLVVDWGLAKTGTRREQSPLDEATVVPLSSDGSTETIMGAVVGTIAYMSPEQAAGKTDLLSPRSDVYCLGSTLFAILSGESPIKKGSQSDMLNSIQNGNITPLKQVVPAVDPALAAICIKAMRTNPQDRFESARAMSKDLERWLADEPVEAYAEPFSKTLWRMARRHRTLVGSALSVLILSLAGLAVFNSILATKNSQLLTANQQIQQQSEQLQQEREQLRASRESLGQLAYNILESTELGLRDKPGIEAFRSEMLSRAHDTLKAAVEFNPESTTLRRSLADSARIIGQQATRIGDEGKGLQMLAMTIPLLEQIYQETADQEQRNETLIDIIETYSDHVGILRRNNRFPEATRSSARSVELLRTLENQSDIPEHQKLRLAGRSLTIHAGVLRDLLEWDDMAFHINRSVEAMKRLQLLVAQNNKLASPNDEVFYHIATELQGEVLLKLNQPDQSARVYNQAITELERTIAEDGTSVTRQYMLAILLNGSGELVNATEQVSQTAIDRQTQAVDLMKKLHQKSQTVGFQERLGNHLTTMAEMQFNLEQSAMAETTINEAIEQLTDLLQKGPAADFRRSLASALETRAKIQRQSGNFDAASKDLILADQLLTEAVSATSSCPAFVDLQDRIRSQLQQISQP